MHEVVVHADAEIGCTGLVGNLLVLVHHVTATEAYFHDRHVPVEQIDLGSYLAADIRATEQLVAHSYQVGRDADTL